MSILRKTLDALLPPGPIWKIKVGGDLDSKLEALGESLDTPSDFLGDLAFISDPDKTPIFEDLEREYGIKPNENVSDADRLARLKRIVYQGEKIDSPDDLQDALNDAGFTDLQVHLNDPAVDPDLFLNQNFTMVAGGDNAYAGFIPSGGGDSTAIAGLSGGEWVVNGEIFFQSPAVTMQASGDNAFAGNANAVAGAFDTVNTTALEYETPPADYWPLTFFVGGAATRDGVTGELTSIEQGLVPNERKDDLITTILQIKPLMGWCGLIVQFT
jgi:hypothetical protein